jgi:phosphoglycerol transferase
MRSILGSHAPKVNEAQSMCESFFLWLIIIMLVLFVFVVSFFFYLSNWVVSQYGNNVAFGQLLFHVQIGFMANEGVDESIIYSFLLSVVLYTVITTLFFGFLSYLLLKYRPTLKKIGSLLVILISMICLFQAKENFNLDDYIKTKLGADIFSVLYRNPNDIEFVAPLKPRNLILLYVESLENDFKNIEGKNLIESIEKLPGLHVPDFQQAPGTNWSIAGMVASQCAIPLKGFAPSDWNVFEQDLFLPNAVCLSDILHKFGYQQIFLTGPDVEFAGVNKFYRTHHFDQMIGRDEAKQWVTKKNLFTGWGLGLHDDTMLDLAYDIAVKSARSSQPFNLTILTTDNHSPHGMASPRCSVSERQTSFVGAVQCSSRYVSRFVERVLKNKKLENTDIVIMGDHLFMAIPEQEPKFSDNRTLFFKYINSRKTATARSDMTHFDVAATILDSLGFLQDSTQKFGLGYSVFVPIDDYLATQTKNLSLEIISPSKTYDALWEVISEQNHGKINE